MKINNFFLSHMEKNIAYNFDPRFNFTPFHWRMLYVKFGWNWPCGYRVDENANILWWDRNSKTKILKGNGLALHF